jgi:hypothetical protein
MTEYYAPFNIKTVNGLNSPLKRCRIEKQLTHKDKHWLRVKAWEKICQVNGP